MRRGKEIYEYYRKYVFEHIYDKSEEAQYARFVYSLLWGEPNTCSPSEVYSKLEQAEQEGKKLSTRRTCPDDVLDGGFEIILV